MKKIRLKNLKTYDNQSLGIFLTAADTLPLEIELEIPEMSDISIGSFTIVNELPQDPNTGTIYLLKNAVEAEKNYYDEYIYVEDEIAPEGHWELIGSTQIDLSNYYTKGDVDGLLEAKANVSSIPTKTSDLTNDSDFTTQTYVDGQLALKADKSTTYTKTEVDNALALKANQVTTYTKTEVDTELALKADKADTYTKSDVYNKTEAEALLDGKVDKVAGKGLSENDFTDALKNKLDGIAAGAEVNVQADWNQTDNTADDYIKNKPTNVSDFTNDAGYLTEHQDISGKQDVINDLETIRSGAALGTTAVQPEVGKGLFSGNYNDLTNKPTIPSSTSDLTNDRFVRYDTSSQGLTTAQKSNARANIGAGTSNFSGAYSSLTGKPTSLSSINSSEAAILQSAVTSATVDTDHHAGEVSNHTLALNKVALTGAFDGLVQVPDFITCPENNIKDVTLELDNWYKDTSTAYTGMGYISFDPAGSTSQVYYSYAKISFKTAVNNATVSLKLGTGSGTTLLISVLDQDLDKNAYIDEPSKILYQSGPETELDVYYFNPTYVKDIAIPTAGNHFIVVKAIDSMMYGSVSARFMFNAVKSNEQFDSVPTQNSDKLVTSGAVYDAIQQGGGGGQLKTINNESLVGTGNIELATPELISVSQSRIEEIIGGQPGPTPPGPTPTPTADYTWALTRQAFPTTVNGTSVIDPALVNYFDSSQYELELKYLGKVEGNDYNGTRTLWYCILTAVSKSTSEVSKNLVMIDASLLVAYTDPNYSGGSMSYYIQSCSVTASGGYQPVLDLDKLILVPGNGSDSYFIYHAKNQSQSLIEDTLWISNVSIWSSTTSISLEQCNSTASTLTGGNTVVKVWPAGGYVWLITANAVYVSSPSNLQHESGTLTSMAINGIGDYDFWGLELAKTGTYDTIWNSTAIIQKYNESTASTDYYSLYIDHIGSPDQGGSGPYYELQPVEHFSICKDIAAYDAKFDLKYNIATTNLDVYKQDTPSSERTQQLSTTDAIFNMMATDSGYLVAGATDGLYLYKVAFVGSSGVTATIGTSTFNRGSYVDYLNTNDAEMGRNVIGQYNGKVYFVATGTWSMNGDSHTSLVVMTYDPTTEIVEYVGWLPLQVTPTMGGSLLNNTAVTLTATGDVFWFEYDSSNQYTGYICSIALSQLTMDVSSGMPSPTIIYQYQPSGRQWGLGNRIVVDNQKIFIFNSNDYGNYCGPKLGIFHLDTNLFYECYCPNGYESGVNYQYLGNGKFLIGAHVMMDPMASAQFKACVATYNASTHELEGTWDSVTTHQWALDYNALLTNSGHTYVISKGDKAWRDVYEIDTTNNSFSYVESSWATALDRGLAVDGYWIKIEGNSATMHPETYTATIEHLIYTPVSDQSVSVSQVSEVNHENESEEEVILDEMEQTVSNVFSVADDRYAAKSDIPVVPVITQKYLHEVYLEVISGVATSTLIKFSIVNASATAFTAESLMDKVYDEGTPLFGIEIKENNAGDYHFAKLQKWQLFFNGSTADKDYQYMCLDEYSQPYVVSTRAIYGYTLQGPDTTIIDIVNPL